MPNKPATQQQLLAENEGLRNRLGEAEETIREIRSGGLDALLAGAAGAQLFTLKDANQTFRLLVEQMGEGALTMTAQGVIVYANRSFSGLLKTPLEKLMGSAARTWIAPDSHPILQSLLEKSAGGARHGELSLAAGDGTQVLVRVSVSHLPIAGMPDAYCLVAIDLTERKRIEAIAASETVARELLAAANQSRGELLCLIEEKTRAETALYKSSETLELATRSASLGIWELDLAANHLIWDARMFELYGIRKEDFGGAYEAWTSGLHPDDRTRGDAAIAAALAGDREFGLEFRVVWPNGEVHDIEAHGLVQRDAQGVATRMVGVNKDITQRKQADARIAYLNRVYAVLSGINTLIVRAQDSDELFKGSCRIALEAGGFRMAMIFMVDRSAMKVVPVASAGKDAGLLTAIKGLLASSDDVERSMVARAIREKQTVVSNDTLGDSRVLLGKQYFEFGVRSMAVFPLLVADEAVGAIALYAREIDIFHEDELALLTELAGDIAFAIDHIDKQDRLQFLAHFDPLTGLANRALFNERLSQSMKDATAAGRKIALGVIDLERLKNINDTLGREAGDELLKQVSEWGLVITGDTHLQARLDADHFAILLPEEAWSGDLPGMAENVMASFRARLFNLKGVEFLMGAKAGLAVFPDDGADPDTLLKNAETALKKAKSSGDRLLFYTQKMISDVADQLAMENRLRQACRNDQFVLHYQPKVDLASGQVTSAEALIRWNDPATGRLVPPGVFIPILEETGMILEVGRWALGQAIKDLLRWSSATAAGFRIAVNVSELQLRNVKFVEEIRQLIAVDPRAAAGLELEITEGIVMYDIDGNIEALRSIRESGVTIAIDDFGTGFSSLGSLAKLPLDTLKIDRSFVIDMNAGPAGLALVSTIIKLAHGMRLKVVAEGVETEEQSRLLRLLQCDEMQGYLFSKPLPAEEFEARFLAGFANAP